MEYHFCGCVISDLEKIKYFIENRMEELNRYIPDDTKMFEIKLIVNELIINGALHGNELSRKKTVYVNIDFNGDMLFIKVRDEGKGIKYRMEDYNPEDMLSTGRGLILVNGLVDELKLDKNAIQAIINL
ncbi:MAG: ATP-binding protein [Tissierellia bacterium]|nr:ATP-binding protein [Tissierellia bacterium]